jgi:two-component system chemotaxis response regulator CheY
MGSILLAEDNPSFSKVIQFQLERSGFSVTTAIDGQEAFDLALKEQFDVVVTDEKMPHMRGQELCRALRNHDRYAETPIILFTTLRAIELDVESITKELELSALLIKPFSPRTLVEIVGSLAPAPA